MPVEKVSAEKVSAGAPAVTRASLVLKTLAAHAREELTLTELSEKVRAAKSSTLAVCTSLEDAGLIQRTPAGYSLGRGVLDLAGGYLAGFEQLRSFYTECAASAALKHLVVQVSMLDGVEALYLARHEGRQPLQLAAGIGSRFPASSTAVGQALLSVLDDAEITRRYEENPYLPVMAPGSFTSLEQVLDEVQQTRARGYALDRERVHTGLVGLAVSLKPWNPGDAWLALGASMPVAEATDARIAEVADGLRELALKLANPLYEV